MKTRVVVPMGLYPSRVTFEERPDGTFLLRARKEEGQDLARTGLTRDEAAQLREALEEVLARPEPEPPTGDFPLPAGAQLLSRCDFDNGQASWYVQSLKSRFSVVDKLGRRCGRFEVVEGDKEPDTGSERSEVSGPNQSAGSNIYAYTLRFLVPSESDTGPSWCIGWQMHSNGGSPPLALFLTDRPDGTFDAKLGHGDGSRSDWTGKGLARDVWHSLYVVAQWDPKGFIEAYVDGALVVARKAFNTTGGSPYMYPKAGIYRGASNNGTTIRYIDDVAVYRLA